MSQQLHERVQSARNGQRQLGRAKAEIRTAILVTLADILNDRKDEILKENQRDLDEAQAANLSGPLLKRLALNESKIGTLIEGSRQLAELADPIGQPVRKTELDENLILTQVTSPLGVILVIFESRPDAVIQIGSLALRSGNAVLLKGGSEATYSNRILVDCLRNALKTHGISPDAVLGIEGREATGQLLDFDDLIDLVIPRGSGSLVRKIQSSTRIPVLGHAEGICHTYIDEFADPDRAATLSVDGKCDYPAACNATETLLIHKAFLPKLPNVAKALIDAGVELRADQQAREVIEEAKEAHDEDWGQEYGDLIVSIKTVSDINEAIAHIHRYGSAHTETIVTESEDRAEQFLREVDSSSVFHNASTRFADGYRYGLGAEVGISTGRIHARGPVGVEGLLTTRWLLRGQGQIVGQYGPGKRQFTHKKLDH